MFDSSAMPTLFVGHGSPDNAFQDNIFTEAWEKVAKESPRPRAILSISAHWVTHGYTGLTSAQHPATIHDFYGFPEDYSRARYAAPGAPDLARLMTERIPQLSLDDTWGLDHGTWSVLTRMYPTADIPVLQMSLGDHLTPEEQFSLGQSLRFLREEGVLIMGSGNIVHHLGLIHWGGEPYPWATAFDSLVAEHIGNADFDSLIDYHRLPHADLAVPTPEHYLPLLTILGASNGEWPTYFNESVFAASIGMRGVLFSKKVSSVSAR